MLNIIWSGLYFFMVGFIILTILHKNPIINILSLITVYFFSAFFILFNLQLDHFAYMILIIYIGAIAILFLFIIMMLNLKKVNTLELRPWFGFFFIFGILFFLVLVGGKSISDDSLYSSYIDYSSIYDNISQIYMLGLMCYTEYFPSFFFGGYILFIAVIASIFISWPSQVLHVYLGKKQLISNQLSKINTTIKY